VADARLLDDMGCFNAGPRRFSWFPALPGRDSKTLLMFS
jgi:hypothetical protein